ncbi:MAG: MoaD/ThiS family protein [Planctomycetes bacterium]|nr:MoaD/ThiS family protein [Planctomycetota bacterium]MBM4079175.1 MoaD/ThiS family protein [Planctomycetota bacterium]MBM4084904.1 MoaD/ThiS family protein [Planctomycetota bacterium]
MAVNVRIPSPLRSFTGGKDAVQTEGKTLREVLNNMEKRHPGLKERICDEAGEVRRFLHVYLNDEDIRFQGNLDAKLKDGDELSIVPAIAGGV